MEDAVDPVRLGEDGRVTDAQAEAKAQAETFGEYFGHAWVLNA